MDWTRETGPGRDPGREAEPPPYAPILERPRFMGLAELEVQKARQFHYPICLVTILVESSDREAVQRTGEAIRSLIRRSDLISLAPGLSALHVLLRDTMPSEVRRVIERIRAAATASSVVLRFGAACLPTMARTLQELMERADQEAVQPRS
jgi:hypothetical protein